MYWINSIVSMRYVVKNKLKIVRAGNRGVLCWQGALVEGVSSYLEIIKESPKVDIEINTTSGFPFHTGHPHVEIGAVLPVAAIVCVSSIGSQWSCGGQYCSQDAGKRTIFRNVLLHSFSPLQVKVDQLAATDPW